MWCGRGDYSDLIGTEKNEFDQTRSLTWKV